MHSLLRTSSLLLACAALAPSLVACDAEPVAPTSLEQRLSQRREQRREHRELARAHANGGVHERLAAEQRLLVDPGLPADTAQVRFVLLPGELAGQPATLAELAAAAHDAPRRERLQAGEDGARPAIFDDVPEGTYTACVVVGPPRDDATAALLARAAAIYEADSGGELSPERLIAAADRAQVETGLAPQTIAWDDLPLRCRWIEVTADPHSRVVALPAA